MSGAGHDACQVCAVAPTGMIFVPCEDGISHNEIESATPEDLEMGCNVLLHAMLSVAGGMPKVLRKRPEPDPGREESAMNWFVAGVVAMTSIVAAISNFLVRIPTQRLAHLGSAVVSNRVSRHRSHQPPCRTGRRPAGWSMSDSRAAWSLSLFTSTVRIALASGTAFLIAQLADVWLYDRMRRISSPGGGLRSISSTLASALDTALFFSLAFAATGRTVGDGWAIGDYGVKIAVACAMLIPFRLLMGERDRRAHGSEFCRPERPDPSGPSRPARAPGAAVRILLATAMARSAGSSSIRMALRRTSITRLLGAAGSATG